MLLRQGGGFGRAVQAGTALAGLVGACDGELTVGQIVGALGALLEVGADAVAADVLPEVRGLVRDGLLLRGLTATSEQMEPGAHICSDAAVGGTATSEQMEVRTPTCWTLRLVKFEHHPASGCRR